MIVSLEALGTNAYNRYAMCPAGNNNKNGDDSPKTLDDKIIKLHLRNLDNEWVKNVCNSWHYSLKRSPLTHRPYQYILLTSNSDFKKKVKILF